MEDGTGQSIDAARPVFIILRRSIHIESLNTGQVPMHA
jgi:hypothetical protein